MPVDQQWHRLSRLSHTIRSEQGIRVVQRRQDALHETTRIEGSRHLRTWHDQSVTLVPAWEGKSRQILLPTYNLPLLYSTLVMQVAGVTYLSLESRQAVPSHRLPPEQTIAH
jgi:hypothetical protein